MFKGKIGKQYVDPIVVTIRMCYSLTKFLNASYLSEKKYAFCDFYEDDECKIDDQKAILPFGVSVDPVMEIVLYCTWPQVAENLIVDSPIYTDLDPMMVCGMR